MNTPTTTYRLQLNKDFTFDDTAAILDYLALLGIDTLYASPIMQAVAGSTHGYDGIDMHRINPEIGHLDQLIGLKKQLSGKGMYWLQDIVPNHMAFAPSNAWLMDLLEHGPSSSYSDYFDTAWCGDWFQEGKIMVPTLGKPLATALADGEISIQHKDGRFLLQYFDQHLPLQPDTVASIRQGLALFEKRPQASTSDAPEDTMQAYLAALNADAPQLQHIVQQQHYELCHWQETDKRINFRRFFTVNGLICLNIQQPQVFEDVHRFVGQLLDKNIIDGLRVDHIDGLYSPAQYVNDLRRLAGNDAYIVVEKILEHGEELPQDWPIAGTTGYDFLAASNNLFIDASAEKALTKFYGRFVGKQPSLKKQQCQKKADVLGKHMQGELDNLFQLFCRLHLTDDMQWIDKAALKQVIAAFLVCFPTYRLYDESFPLAPASYKLLGKVFARMRKLLPQSPDELSAFTAVFAKAQAADDAAYGQRAARFLSRCMQFTGPVMAKGVEDTLMYTYNRFIGSNEVGGHPAQFGLAPSSFHTLMLKRQKEWPRALNASATHDTKRGEDVRSRLQVLTACPDVWTAAVKKWHKIVTKQYRGTLPQANDIYFIYQSLFGAVPLPGAPDPHFEDRLLDYLTKYLREGKQHSDWAAPDEQYEALVHDFTRFLLIKEGDFFRSFMELVIRLLDFGIINSLAQLTLKLTAPGIPDVYQGTELWDLSFVDPDNRRPVDYALRMTYVQEIEAINAGQRLSTLWAERHNGKIKLHLLRTLATLRKQAKSLSPDASYLPLALEGKYKDKLLAFARQHRGQCTVVILPLHLASIAKLRKTSTTDLDWEDTRLYLPTEGDTSWVNVLSGHGGTGHEIRMQDVFTSIPLAVLHYDTPTNPRRAGILMHISSLPSANGIGDLGKPAHDFARALHAAGQRYWQVLPLGPLSQEQYYSPYSTLSAMAGNPLFIDLEDLADQGLLDHQQLRALHTEPTNRVDYDAVSQQKHELLAAAFDRAAPQADRSFLDFCQAQDHWLADYALFMGLRALHGGAPWYRWKKEFKQRNAPSLLAFQADNARAIEREKWMQYIFFKQWAALRAHCYGLQVELLGDIPIYVGHDSADVWANRDLFSLTATGAIAEMAGVPPDYFNADGQQWGMPVFRWQNHRKQGYAWWLQRVAHNLALFDKVRLDHFRAFAAYWSIPAAADTAAQGRWVDAPGKELFALLKSNFPDMPFIAEDLGDIDDAVYGLRDAHALPGMKVLQFAFGDDQPKSPHIPHHYTRNFVVYTGTHDNNTTVGWFKNDLDENARRRLQAYLSSVVYSKNVADLLIQTAYASVADTAIIPMQDVLSLGKKHRMNTPSSTLDNWSWRMLPNTFGRRMQDKLRQWTICYDRM